VAISAQVNTENTFVAVSVSDTGIGIPGNQSAIIHGCTEKALEIIFEDFKQLDGSIAREYRVKVVNDLS